MLWCMRCVWAVTGQVVVGGGGDMVYVGCVTGDVVVGGCFWQRATWQGDSGSDMACCLPTSLDEMTGTSPRLACAGICEGLR